MSKQEWQKSKDSDIEFDYYIWLGPVCFRLLDYGRGWRVFVPSNLNYYLEITPMSPEEAQAAALAWARKVLGEALVEAGAGGSKSLLNGELSNPGTFVQLFAFDPVLHEIRIKTIGKGQIYFWVKDRATGEIMADLTVDSFSIFTVN